MTLADEARRTAHDLVALVGGGPGRADLWAEGANVWLPDNGWSGPDEALGALAAVLDGAAVVGGPVVASASTVVAEMTVERAGQAGVPMTATLQLDDQARIIEARLYLDPLALGGP